MDPASASWIRRRFGLRKTDLSESPVSLNADRAVLRAVGRRSVISAIGLPRVQEGACLTEGPSSASCCRLGRAAAIAHLMARTSRKRDTGIARTGQYPLGGRAAFSLLAAEQLLVQPLRLD